MKIAPEMSTYRQRPFNALENGFDLLRLTGDGSPYQAQGQSLAFRKIRCRGASLLAVLSAMVLLSLLAASAVLFVSTGLQTGVQSARWSDAYAAAEAGISMAKAWTGTNAAWTSSVPYTITGAIGRATFSVVISSTNKPEAIMTSTGMREDSQWTSIWKGIR